MGVRVSKVLWETPLLLAVIVAVEIPETGRVPMENAAAVAPAGTVIESGTLAEVLSLASETGKPPAGAGLVSWIVPVDWVPPTVVEGLRLRELGPVGVPGGTIVRGALTDPPLYDATTVTRAINWIGEVCIVNVADMLPAGTKVLKLDETPATGKPTSFDSAMPAPPSGAGAVSVTVPVVVSPLSIVDGLKLNEARNGSGGTSVKVPV